MSQSSTSHAVISSLEANDVRFLRILWCDNANIIRGKAVHRGMLSHYIEHGVGICAGQQGVPVMYDAVMPDSGLSPVGEIRLVPDWSNLVLLPYASGHAQVMGDMIYNKQPWALCPRNFLKRMIDIAAGEGIEIQAAFENEFYLLQQTDSLVPVDETLFAAAVAMDINREVIDEIAEALIAQGIPVEQYYPESGFGQQEISMRYSSALVAADRQIIFRNTVRAIAFKHRLKASFLPKIFPDAAGSGCHLHLSLWHDGKNLVPSEGIEGLSSVARAFIAGILHHLPALIAITTPSPNSYRRLRPHYWSGAFRCWGIDNREAAIRVPSDPEHQYPTHFELKTVDATSNPYLALGAVIAAGIDGVRHNSTLGESINVDPGLLSPTELQKRGIDPLPKNLAEAIAHLKQNTTLLSALNPQLAQAFLAVRQAECEAMQNFDLAAEVKLLLERY